MRIIVLAALIFTSATCKTSDTSTMQMQASASASPAAGSADPVIRVVADDKGYTPSSITVQRGKPVTLEFVRTSDKTCAKEVVFSALGISKPLPLNTPVDIILPTDASKTYSFACGMDMFKGKLVVQ